MEAKNIPADKIISIIRIIVIGASVIAFISANPIADIIYALK